MIVSLPHVALPPARLPLDRLAIESVVYKRRPTGVELSHRSQLGRMHVCHTAATTTADPWLLSAPTFPGWRRHSLGASKEGGDSRTAPASYFGSWVTPARAPYGESRAGAGAVPLGEHQTNDGKLERLLTTLRVPILLD